MLKLPLWTLLVILAALLACGEQTPTQGGAVATVPATAEGPTSLPSPVTPAAEPTEILQAVPTETSGPGATTTPLPANTPAPEATSETTPAPGEESPNKAITPLMLDDPQTVTSEISDSELACLGGTSDIGRLSRIFSGIDESTPQELTQILGCLQDEIILRMFLGGVIRDPAPLSLETGACIRDALEGTDLRSAMLAATLGNGQNDVIVVGVLVTIACLNDEEWETAATVANVDPDTGAALLCRLEEIVGTEGMIAALEAGDEGKLTALLDEATGCELEMEGGPEPAFTPTPASPQTKTLVITVAEVPVDIPDYDRGEWKHWVDADGDCQDARQEVLIEESLEPVIYETDRECRVATGLWWAPHLGHHLGNPSHLDVDHHVPLKNAHDSGGWNWSPAEKERYANYLGEENHLVAISSRHNRSKGARGPEEWAPPDNTLWCDYARDWAEIKERWNLTMTPVESEIVMDMLGTCDNPLKVDVRTAMGKATGEHKPTAEPEETVYGSCEAAEDAGETLVQGSQGGGRGFPAKMVPSARDGDGDGVVCER